MGIHGNAELLNDIRRGVVLASEETKRRLIYESGIEKLLYDVIYMEELEDLTFLMDAGVNPNMHFSFENIKAMGLACKRGHLRLAKLLRSRGAELRLCYDKEFDSNIPSEELVSATESEEVREWLNSCPPKGELSPAYFCPPEETELFSTLPLECISPELQDQVEVWQTARWKEIRARQQAARRAWKVARGVLVAFYWWKVKRAHIEEVFEDHGCEVEEQTPKKQRV